MTNLEEMTIEELWKLADTNVTDFRFDRVSIFKSLFEQYEEESKEKTHVLDAMLKNAKWRYRGLWYYKDENNKLIDVQLPHGPVVDERLLDEVIDKSEDYKLKNKKLGKKNYCYLLSNILVDEDGTGFKGHSANGRGGRYRYYKNPNYKRGIRADDIHDFIVNRFRAYIMETKIIQRMIDDEFKNRVSNVPKIEREVRQIKKRLIDEEKTIKFYEREGVQGIGSEMCGNIKTMKSL